MQITRNGLDTAAGPGDWFTGSVHVDTIAVPSNEWRVAASSVHFAPGAPRGTRTRAGRRSGCSKESGSAGGAAARSR
jgi:hypothetical protein